MEFFKIRRTIPFMRHALVFNIISLVTFLLAVFFLATKGLNFSIEFTGGTLIEVGYEQPADSEDEPRFAKIVFAFDGGGHLAFEDMRLFGLAELIDSPDALIRDRELFASRVQEARVATIKPHYPTRQDRGVRVT